MLAQYKVGLSVTEISAQAIANAVNILTDNPSLYTQIQQQCNLAKIDWNWENEKQILLQVYHNIDKL